MFGFLGLLILLTLLLYKELHKYLLTTFYEEPAAAPTDTTAEQQNNLTTSQGRLLKNLGPTPQDEVSRHFTLDVEDVDAGSSQVQNTFKIELKAVEKDEAILKKPSENEEKQSN